MWVQIAFPKLEVKTMAFNNIPPNGFPALPDIEDLEAVVKDVNALKSSVLGLTEDVTDLNEQKANQITIAPFFNSETAYEIGDLVYYNGLTYRCTNAHEGEWDSDDFVGTTIANELDTLKSGLTNLQTVTITASEGVTISNASIKRVGKVIIGYATIELASEVAAYGVIATLSVNVASKVMYPTDSGKFFYTAENDNKVRVWRQTSTGAYIVQFVAFAND